MPYMRAKYKGVVLKICFVCDPHYRAGFPKPVGRTAEFENQIASKRQFMKEYCIANNIDLIGYTGDVLDRKAPSDYTYYQITANENALMEIESEIPQYTIFGNHDLPYSSLQMKNGSMLQYFMNHGCISAFPYFNQDEKVAIYGVDFKENLEENLLDLERIHALMDPNNYNIVVIHQHFAPQNSQINELNHSSYKRYSSLYHLGKINAFVMGHLHVGFPTETINNPNSGRKQHYINPWNMTRLARSYYSVNEQHKPEFVILDTETSEVTHVEFPHAPYSEAFVVEEMRMNEEFNDSLQAFMSNLTKTSAEDDFKPSNKIESLVNFYLDKADGQ